MCELVPHLLILLSAFWNLSSDQSKESLPDFRRRESVRLTPVELGKPNLRHHSLIATDFTNGFIQIFVSRQGKGEVLLPITRASLDEFANILVQCVCPISLVQSGRRII